MKYHVFICISGFLLAFMTLLAGRSFFIVPIMDENSKNLTVENIKWRELSPLVSFEREGRQEGVSAAFGGSLGDAVVIAGGCNFPVKNVVEGGTKVYYDRIQVMRSPGSVGAVWEDRGQLPVPSANGASVTLAEGVVCIGGKNESGALNQVCLLKWNADRSAMITDRLADLPVPMEDMAAGTDGTNIYVAGGNCNGIPENRCFVLNGIQAREWKELPDFPGISRVQPVGAVMGGKFYLMGGFQPVREQQGCQVADDGLCYDPVTAQWSSVAKIIPAGEKSARAVVGAAGVALDSHTLIIQGGVDREVFKTAVDNPLLQQQAIAAGNTDELQLLKKAQADYLRHEPGWYKFNRQLLIYHTGQDRWESMGDFPGLARAGAVMILHGEKLIVVNGETKPGIRSAAVTETAFRILKK